jgi:hypothetical protein
MSYDIALYHRKFLKRAIEEKLDDWLGADPIPEQIIQAVLVAAKAVGFVETPFKQPSAPTSLEGIVSCRAQLLKKTPIVLAQMHVFEGQIAFTIPYGPLARDSVVFCTRLAKQIGKTHSLGYRDSQTGEALYD